MSLKEKQLQVHILMAMPLLCHLCTQQDTNFVQGTELSTLELDCILLLSLFCRWLSDLLKVTGKTQSVDSRIKI